jgi:superfamily II DNA or RNA helicase
MEPIALREYQGEALEAWRARGRYGAVVLPTGTGKTYLGLEAVREELEAGGRAAVVVPTIALAHQWRRRLEAALDIYVGLYYGEERSLARATVFVVNSAYLNVHLLNAFTLAVIDEAHHLGAPRWSLLLRALRGRRILGLTATPERCPLPVIYQMGFPQARQRKAVVGVAIRPIYVPLSLEEWAKYHEVEDEMRRAMLALSLARRRGDAALQRRLEERLHMLANRRKQITSLVAKKFEALVDLALRHPDEKVLAFTESVSSAERARRILVEAGVPAMTYHSLMSRREREAALHLWGRPFRVLVAVRCLDEGIDVPEVAVGAIMASGKTTRQLVQRLGRILRPAPGKERATMYVIVAQGTYEHSILAKLMRLAS